MTPRVREQAVQLAAELTVAQVHRANPAVFTFVQSMRFGPCMDLSDYAMERWMTAVRWTGQATAYSVWLSTVERGEF